MPETAHAAAGAHDAGFSVSVAPPPPKPTRVEADNGWTVGADSDEELLALAGEKLRQAEQNRADADQAITHWTAVAAAVKAHK